MKLSIIIPCYNEEEGIAPLRNKLSPILDSLLTEWELELLFIDDGSKDKTCEKIKENFSKESYNAQIFKHEVNQNLGAAMRTGFSHATGDVIVTMDSDCTYDVEEIFSLLNEIKKGADVVTASPYHPLGGVENVPKYRLVLSRSISAIYRSLTNSKLHTYTALFRAQKKEVVQNISFKSNNFLATAEFLINAINNGYVVKEVPMVLRVRQYGVSKMRLLKVIRSHLKYVLFIIGSKFKRSA
ncbi:MAG: glycosyltransferase family 2 protein [archaeon]|nr:glycosyltransferase family 2 protein [archaeon]